MVQPSQQYIAAYVKGDRHERFENGGSVFGRHPRRGYTGDRRSPTHVDALPSVHPFSRLMQHAGKRWMYSTPQPQEE